MTELQAAVQGLTDEIDAGGPRYLLGLLADAIEDEDPENKLPYALRKIMRGSWEPLAHDECWAWVCDHPSPMQSDHPHNLWYWDWNRLESFDERFYSPTTMKLYYHRSRAFFALAMLPYFQPIEDQIPF